jgi:hypothetical protein
MDAKDPSEGHGPPGQPFVYPGEPTRVPDEALQYAYGNDLITDYTLNSFSITHLLTDTVRGTLPSIAEDGFTGSSHLPDLEIPGIELRSERLAISQSAETLIREVHRELPDDQVQFLTQDIIDSGNTRHLKLELPLLRTDNERDMREFREEMAARREVRIGDHRLPLDPVTEEDGEGMQLPAYARSDANEFLRKLENEKLGITRSSFQFLADVVKDDYSEEKQWNYLMEQVRETTWVKVSNHTTSALTWLSLHGVLS